MVRLYMQGLHRVPNTSDYGSIRLNNAWICLNMPEHGWIFLNVPECMSIPEYAWINYSDYARVLNIPRYSYNNIIFATKVTGL